MRRLPFMLFLAMSAGSLYGAEAVSPFAGKPCDSYSGYNDEKGKPVPLIWGQAPFADFGSRPVTFNTAGVRKLNPAPPPGIHPRICFGPDDLPEVRKRLKETRCGQEAWKNILCWTEMMKGTYDDTADYAKPDRWNGSFGGLHGRVPLFRLGVPRENGVAYNRHPKAAAIYQGLAAGTATDFPPFYWNTMALEAFRCLIYDDQSGGKTLAKAVITAMKIDQAKRDAERQAAQAKKPDLPLPPPSVPVGGFQFSFCYDFLFNWLAPEQRQAMHDELAATTWSHDNYGTFNTAESSRSNWATFSYWLYHVLAIEGEPGFNDLKVRGMFRGWRNLLTYGWFQSGATFEGEAKNQLGMDGIILFSMRASTYGFDNLSGHPYLQAYARNFLPHSANAMLNGFHKYDLLGGSRAARGGAAPMDSIGLKFMFPEDKVIDWYYRQTMGDDYSGVPDRPDGYFNALLFYAIYAIDFDPANNDPGKLGLGNTFFCGERALMMTRSSWEPTAMQLNLHVRQANGGHAFADRNAIMVAGAGRIWSPNGYANFKTQENSVVCIDGQSQNLSVPGRMVDFRDAPLATFATGDAKYCWDWNWRSLNKNGGYYTAADVKNGTVAIPPGCEPELHTVNDFAYLKLPFAYLNRPMLESGHWILPSGAISPVVRQPNLPVVKAFRTAGLVRGERPYALIVDDIQRDAAPHHYDWTLMLESDIQIARTSFSPNGECDIYLTGADPDRKLPANKDPLPSALPEGSVIPAGQPVLLVRVLNRSLAGKADARPEIVELPNLSDPKKYSKIRRLLIPADSVAPDFKVLLYPFRQGEPVPATAWNAARTKVTLKNGAGTDEISFRPAASGKTDIEIKRGGTVLIEMNREIAPMKDILQEQQAAREREIRQRLANFNVDAIPGRQALPETGGESAPGKVGKAMKFSGAKEGITIPLDLKSLNAATGFTVAFWARPTEPAGLFFSANDVKGLSISIERQNELRINALGQHRWKGNTPMDFGRWHHLAVTSDGKRLTVYADGRPVKSDAIDKPFQFGLTATLGSGFAGLIDDLRLYNRALTDAELENLFNYQMYVQPAR